MREMKERTQAVIRLDALRHNIENIHRRLSQNCEIMAVLKGDGYGHGLASIYPTLKQAGIRRYAVAIVDEGIMLRNAGCEDPILILGDTCDYQFGQLIEYRLTPTVFTLEMAVALNALAAARNTVQPIHIKLDTGMSRLGFPCEKNSIEQIKQIYGLSHISITGIFTHFSRADEPDGLVVGKQMKQYLDMVNALQNEGVSIPFKHLSNSPAILLHPQAQLDAVRAGDILYGLCPVDEDLWLKEDFRQVLAWYTIVAHVKEIPAGTQIGYGGTYVAKEPMKIATIPVGFADGYSRRLSNLGKVRIHGQDAPIVGRICMDQFMVDVTHIDNVRRADTVTLLDDDLSITWMADLIGANVDEIVCGISKRVPRVYE